MEHLNLFPLEESSEKKGNAEYLKDQKDEKVTFLSFCYAFPPSPVLKSSFFVHMATGFCIPLYVTMFTFMALFLSTSKLFSSGSSQPMTVPGLFSPEPFLNRDLPIQFKILNVNGYHVGN